MIIKKPKMRVFVGLRLFRLNVGNNARHVPQVLTPVVVTKVGRKYFWVKRERTDNQPWGFESRHLVECWTEDNGGYTPNYALYESEQEWADSKERICLAAKIKSELQWDREYSLETLRAIANIMWPVKSVEEKDEVAEHIDAEGGAA